LKNYERESPLSVAEEVSFLPAERVSVEPSGPSR